MRSIRLSLLVYFLGLLALALGVVSVLVYRTTQKTLDEKNEATALLIQKQYEELCAKERVRLDEALLADARRVADHARIRVDGRSWQFSFEERQPLRRPASAPGLLILGPVPNGNVVTAVSVLAALNSVAGHPRFPLADVKFADGEMIVDEPPEHDRSVLDHIEIRSNFPITAAYNSRGRDGLSLTLPDEVVPTRESLGPEYRDVELSPGVVVRRVVFRYNFHAVNTPVGRAEPPGPGEPRLPRPPRAPYRSWGTVEAAYEVAAQDKVFAGFREQKDRELAELAEKTQTSLASLRRDLLLTDLATFAAVVLGVYFLVRLGLLPLKRLGDAVSQVSERDFSLRLRDERLPTELAPIVDRLKHTLEQLRLAFEREKQAAADISHELRTPVAALLTTIEVTLKKPRRPEEYREVLMECRESGQQISQLVERLLTLARMDAGVDRLRVEKVDAVFLAEQCAALVRPLAEARGLTLRLHTGGEAVLRADPAKLREVLNNLLHNAIEYNRPAGSIDLTVARDNGTLRVEVRDTGVGIAPEARARIFERFYRADPSRQAEGLHAGLGLAIVKGYVDLMGGSVAVESAVGQGSTFRVELPAA